MAFRALIVFSDLHGETYVCLECGHLDLLDECCLGVAHNQQPMMKRPD